MISWRNIEPLPFIYSKQLIKYINYFPLNPQTLLGALDGVMRERDLATHWLITPAPGDPLQATGELVAGPLELRERRSVGGYNAYLFARP